MAKATKKKPAPQSPIRVNPKTLAAPKAAPHTIGINDAAVPTEVAQPPGLNTPPLQYSGGGYIMPRMPIHYQAWLMDQLPWFDENGELDGGPIIPG